MKCECVCVEEVTRQFMHLKTRKWSDCHQLSLRVMLIIFTIVLTAIISCVEMSAADGRKFSYYSGPAFTHRSGRKHMIL